MNPNLLCQKCMNQLRDINERCPICGSLNSELENENNQLPIGSILAGKYLVGAVIGQGGFGITYVGYNLNLEQKVAIKEYYPEGFAGRDNKTLSTVLPLKGEKGNFYLNGKDKFIEEAKTLAKFSHTSGIVTVHDFFKENNTAYIVMDFVEGQTIKQLARKRGGRLSSTQVLNYLSPLFDSLEQVHKQGLLHRDISPDNIIVTPNGEAILLDFGAARQISAQGEHSNTINVKHGFAPEEQYRTRGNQGPWSDVYALCATMYYLTTGKVPPQAMDRMMGDAQLISPNQLGADWLSSQEQAILKGLSVKGIDRQQTANELKNALLLNQNNSDYSSKKMVIKSNTKEEKRDNNQVKNDPSYDKNKKSDTGKKSSKKSLTKAIIGIAISLLLVAGILCYFAFIKLPASGTDNGNGMIVFGEYEQDNIGVNGKEPIEWKLLTVEDNKALIISKYALDCKKFDSSGKAWEGCSLRTWLNGSFVSEAFSSEEQALIITTDNKVEDRVFLLSLSEAEQYFLSDEIRKCIPTKYAIAQGAKTDNSYTLNGEKTCWWWLRTNGYASDRTSYVSNSGSTQKGGLPNDSAGGGVRPAIWVDLEVVYATQDKQSKENDTTQEKGNSVENPALMSYKTTLFGAYEQDNNIENGKEPIEWLILEETDTEQLLISRYCLDAHNFNDGVKDYSWGSAYIYAEEGAWNSSKIRTWLNKDFYNEAFSSSEQKIIAMSTVKAHTNKTYPKTKQGTETYDKVFLLSISEAEKYFKNDNIRKAAPTQYAVANGAFVNDLSGYTMWWLRTNGSSDSTIAYVFDTGSILKSGVTAGNEECTIRPAIWVKKEAISTLD